MSAVSALRSAGYESPEIGVYLMSGLPGQTREEVEESMRKVKEAGARPYLSEFSPIPGTRIWEAAKRPRPTRSKRSPSSRTLRCHPAPRKDSPSSGTTGRGR